MPPIGVEIPVKRLANCRPLSLIDFLLAIEVPV